MKKYLFPQLVIAMAGLWTVSGFSASARHQSPPYSQAGSDASSTIVISKKGGHAMSAPMQKPSTRIYENKTEAMSSPAHKSPSQYVTVDISLNFDERVYRPSLGVLLDETTAEALYPTIDEPFSCDILAGNYSLVYSFDKFDDKGCFIGIAYVILENLSIENECSFEINPEDACRHIHFAPVAPDGKPIRLDNLSIYISEDDTYEKVNEEGNIDFLAWQFEPWNKYARNGLYSEFASDYEGYIYIDNELHNIVSCPTDIWISEVSDDWVPMMSMIFGADNKFNIAMFTVDETTSGTLSNSMESYYQISYPSIQQSLFGATNEHPMTEEYIMTDVYSDYDDKIFNPIIGAVPKDYLEYYSKGYTDYRVAETPVTKHRERIHSRIQPSKYDAVVKYQVDTLYNGKTPEIVTSYNLSSIDIPPFYINNGNITPVYHMEETYYHQIWDNSFNMLKYCSHPWLPSIDEIKDITYGSTPNYISGFMSGLYNKYNDGMGMHIRNLDLYGASNGTIAQKGVWSVEYNGEDLNIDSSLYSRPEEWAWFRDLEGHPAGKYTLHFTTPLEIVDGLEGHTYFTAEFDQRKADCTAPAIQFMTMANPKGEHTNIFDTPDDAIIRITGGDFDWNTETNLPAPVPCEMIVELSPYSLGLWERVEMKPADIDLPPHFAESFEGVPANISNTSESGWYDLRISMTDTSGNYMTQTISPAFKVNSLKTGVSSVVRESSVKVMNNNIIVPEGAVIYTSSGIPTDGNNVSEGIYIVLYNGNSSKVVVK